MTDFYTVEGVLAADVANAGTFTIGWPDGARLGSFRSGKEHKLMVGQTFYNAPTSFTVAYTSATVITITNGSGVTWEAGSRFRVQLDIGGAEGVQTAAGVAVNNTNVLTAVRVNLGAPLTADADGLSTIATTAGTADVILNGAAVVDGVAVLDVPRNITNTGATTDHSGVTLTIYGTDEYGNDMIETMLGNNASTVAGKKAFKTVTRIASSGALATTGITVGFGDVLGLPVFADAQTIVERQDGVKATAGTFVAGLSPLTKSTATTADVRGTYDPNAACDGAKVFELDLLVADPTFLGNPQYDG